MQQTCPPPGQLRPIHRGRSLVPKGYAYGRSLGRVIIAFNSRYTEEYWSLRALRMAILSCFASSCRYNEEESRDKQQQRCRCTLTWCRFHIGRKLRWFCNPAFGAMKVNDCACVTAASFQDLLTFLLTNSRRKGRLGRQGGSSWTRTISSYAKLLRQLQRAETHMERGASRREQ